jgi:hypothetical protein
LGKVERLFERTHVLFLHPTADTIKSKIEQVFEF